MVNYKNKYIKYKLKYLKLKQNGGAGLIDFDDLFDENEWDKEIDAMMLALENNDASELPPAQPLPQLPPQSPPAKLNTTSVVQPQLKVSSNTRLVEASQLQTTLPIPIEDLSNLYVYLDLDETLGFFGMNSTIYKKFKKYIFSEPPIDLINYLFDNGVVRPHLKKFLQTLDRWKKEGKIHGVGIFTAASNKDGWVNFNKKCLENYTGTLFDKVITREIALAHGAEMKKEIGDNNIIYKRIIKNLKLVSPIPENVILVDDKPEYVINGIVIDVPQYIQELSDDDFNKLIGMLKKYNNDDFVRSIQNDRENHPPRGLQNQTNDNTFEIVLERIALQFEIQM